MTDTISGLDWLDVTTSANQSYNYVSSRFGVGEEYEGWRYATGVEFNQLISHYTGVTPILYQKTTTPEILTDELVDLLGSTLDNYYLKAYGVTYDAYNGYAEGTYDYTMGLLQDRYSDQSTWIGLISDYDIFTDFLDTAHSHYTLYSDDYITPFLGSYLVRDTVSAVPVPAAVWLMGSGLLGLIGFSRKKKLKLLRNPT